MQTSYSSSTLVEKAIRKLPVARPTYTLFKNILVSHRFSAQAREDFEQNDIILVHQMGKVGSTSVVSSLDALDLGRPIYKTHYLNPETVQRLWAEKVSYSGRPIKPHYLANRYLGELIAEQGTAGKNWKVISLVREPVSGNISRMFQSINDYFPNFRKGWENGSIDVQDLIDAFFDDFPHHDWCLNWFDLEMQPVFGIDVYAFPFPMEKGYQVIEEDGVDLLLLKLEDLNNCAASAFKEFLHIDDFELSGDNVANAKSYQEAYRQFKKTIVFPTDYLDRLLDSKYTRHFYIDQEIEAIKAKWTR